MEGPLTAAVARLREALMIPGCIVEEMENGSFSVLRTLEADAARVDVWNEGEWVRVRCRIQPVDDVSDQGLLDLLRFNQRAQRIRVAVDDDGFVVVRGDYPSFIWDETDFRSVVLSALSCFGSVENFSSEK